jgi:hypothetical protein
LLAFLAYFDASGDDIDPKAKVVSVGGFIATEEVWADYERRWSAMLAEFGLTEFHMKDYTSSNGEFATWKKDEDKRRAFMVALTRIIRDLDLVAVGGTIPLSVYRLANRSHCIEEAIGTPYTVAAMMAWANAHEWRDESRNPPDPIVFFVEKGDNRQADYRRKLARIGWGEQGQEPIIMSKKRIDPDGSVHYVQPFQVADFIAYEQAKVLTDYLVHRKTQVRQSFRQAIPPVEERKPYWALMFPQARDVMIERFRIPRRYNHFLSGTRKQRLIGVDPLCYVNGQPVASYIMGDGYLHPDWPFVDVH